MPDNCSDKHKVYRAPSGPVWGSEHVGVVTDKRGRVPSMSVIWSLPSNGK